MDSDEFISGWVGDFIAKERPPMQWTINTFVPVGTKMFIYGDTGIGKSTIAMAMAKAVCDGTPLFDRFPVKQGKVLYIQVDMPEAEWDDRCRKAFAAIECKKNFRHMFFPTAFNIEAEIANPKSRVIEEIKDHDPDFMMIDVVSETHERDENVPRTPGAVYKAWRQSTKRLDTTQGFWHHEKKTPTEGQSDKHFYSGHAKWLNMCSSGWRAYKKKGSLWLKCTKNRNRREETIAPIQLEIPEETLIAEVSYEKEVDRWLATEILRRRYSKQYLAHKAQTDFKLFLSKSTAYERLKDYVEPEYPEDPR